MNISKVLKQRMHIKKQGGEWVWIRFKYEKIFQFCFVCGLLNHIESLCPIVYASSNCMTDKPYGAFMLANNRRTNKNQGERWLRDAPRVRVLIVDGTIITVEQKTEASL